MSASIARKLAVPCAISPLFFVLSVASYSYPQDSFRDGGPTVVANVAGHTVRVQLDIVDSAEKGPGEGSIVVDLPPGGILPLLQVDEGCEIAGLPILGPSEMPLRARIAPGTLIIFCSPGRSSGPATELKIWDPHSVLSEGKPEVGSSVPRLELEHSLGYRSSGWRACGGVVRTAVLPVKLLVDDEEPAAQQIWEVRLRRRIEMANQILGTFFPVRLEIVAVESWESDDSLPTLEPGYHQFATEVDPKPGALAIGFASQWVNGKSPSPLGTCSGPLSQHILLREHGPGITETERLEMLLHEVGHVLGAAHVDDPQSVMRPKLEDRRARERQFSLGFDPLNTLIMNQVLAELSAGHRQLEEFSDVGLHRLMLSYRWLANVDRPDPTVKILADRLGELVARRTAMPKEALAGDFLSGPRTAEPGEQSTKPQSGPSQGASMPQGQGPATAGGVPTGASAAIPASTDQPQPKPVTSPQGPLAPQLAEKSVRVSPRESKSPEITDQEGGPREPPAAGSSVEAARWVIQSVVQQWPGAASDLTDRSRPIGDQVLEKLVRQAAKAAASLPAEESRRRGAFLLALGILVDDSEFLRQQPALGSLWQQLEDTAQRAERLKRIPLPTIEGRHDWAQHFGVSAALTELLGPGPARSLGLAKEWRDAHGDSGFSFTDLAADYAGVAFAQGVRSGSLPLEELSRSFILSDYVPRLSGYDEEIPLRRFIAEYGGFLGQRTQTVIQEIEAAIKHLPGYAASHSCSNTR